MSRVGAFEMIKRRARNRQLPCAGTLGKKRPMQGTQSMDANNVQKRALTAVQELYERPIMNNIERATYVEALVAELLSPDWTLSWKVDYDWAPWDLKHKSGFHLARKTHEKRTV